MSYAEELRMALRAGVAVIEALEKKNGALVVEVAALRAELLSAREALRECAQQLDDTGASCWCVLPTMIPYRGHDSGCLAARAALSPSPKGTP